MKKVYYDAIHPRDSKITTNKRFVNIDNGQMGGNHWTCFSIKDRKSFYFDSFGGQPDKFLPNKLSKLITFLSYKIEDINSRLCGTYCLYFFDRIEGMNSYDAIFKICFG